MNLLAFVCSLLAIGIVCNGLVTDFIAKTDQDRLKEVLRAQISDPKDVAITYHAIQALQVLNDKNELNKIAPKVCKFVSEQKDNFDSVSFESALQMIKMANSFNCNSDIKSKLTEKAKKIVAKGSIESLQEVETAIEILEINKLPIDNKANILSLIQTYLKTNDSLLNFGRAFHIASKWTEQNKLFEYVEDVLAQVTETRTKAMSWLQFEGGLSVTAYVLTGIVKLAKAHNKPLPITQNQADLFANYLVSRKSVKSAKGIFFLLEMARCLADSPLSPIAVTNPASRKLAPENPQFSIKICDILERPARNLAPNDVSVESIKSLNDQSEVAAKKTVVLSKKDATVFEMEDKLSSGHYSITIAIRNFGSVQLTSTVTRPLSISQFVIDVVANDRLVDSVQKIEYPKQLPVPLKGDANSKLIVKLKTSPAGPLEQVFLRFQEINGSHELYIPLTIANSKKQYNYESLIRTMIKKHKIEANIYAVELIVGDAEISNPLVWQLGQINFDNTERKLKLSLFEPLAEIRHKFREAEKRPPPIVSLVFTGLCLVPIAILFVSWYRLGVNIKNFKFNLDSILFHGSIAGKFRADLILTAVAKLQKPIDGIKLIVAAGASN